MAERFDVVVIGGGPGGYAAAIRCAQKGASVALVEKKTMGGTCLNVGCIPSKALLASVHFLTQARHANLMGLEIQGTIAPNWPKMIARKDAIVSGFTKGVTGLVQSNGIKIYEGVGIAAAAGEVVVRGQDEVRLEGRTLILATGSEPISVPAFPFDYQTVISSTEALSLPAIPSALAIIGGGVIGCEMACIYAAVGCKVTILEAMPQLLPHEDEWVGALLAREFKKMGIDSKTACKVAGVQVGSGTATVRLEDGSSIPAEKVLVAVGRRACCDKETIQNLGLQMRGTAVAVNKRMQTNVPGVYAVGDAAGTTYLAHGAFQEAEVAAENATGHSKEMGDYALIPRAVYSFPEAASVGLSERKCAERGIAFTVGKAPFRSNGRSVAHNEGVGEIRVIRSKADNTILGVTMVGATATELISAARAMLGTKEPIEDICFAHPTVSEVLKEAWEDALGISLHVPPANR